MTDELLEQLTTALRKIIQGAGGSLHPALKKDCVAALRAGDDELHRRKFDRMFNEMLDEAEGEE